MSVIRDVGVRLGRILELLSEADAKGRDATLPAPSRNTEAVRALIELARDLSEERANLESRPSGRAGPVAGVVFDFDDARVEIRGRLDRLRAARDAGELS